MADHESPGIKVQPSFCILCALSVLMLPVKWVIAWMLASLVHELAHYLSLRAFGIEVRSITLGAFGAVMQTAHMEVLQTAVCSVAGPMGGLLLLFMANEFPLLAICGFIQSTVNLLPIYPLDGGRALQAILSMLFSARVSACIAKIINAILIIAVSAVSLYATIRYNAGLRLLIVPLLLLLKTLRIKIPCKHRKQIVQ